MEARRHHYAFSHVFLPKQAHASPDKLITELRGPMREGFLFFLWDELGKQLGDAVPAVGLNVAGMDEHDGDTYVLVAMPEPEAPGETHWLAIVHRPGRTQTFVLDRNFDGTGGTLAKLGPDGSRLSYGACGADKEAFLAKVVEIVRTEPDAGAPRAAAPQQGPVTGSVWSQSAPGFQSLGTPPPVSPSRQPPPRKKSSGRTWLALGGGCLGMIVLLCGLSGVLAYDGGSDFEEEPFTVSSTTELDGSGHEQIVLEIRGGPEWASYDISGPAVPVECHHVTEYRPRCVVPVGELTQRSLQYRVNGRGRAPSFFDELRVGSVPTSEQAVTVERPTGLEWSDARRTTVCRGASCELHLTAAGYLELAGAPGAEVRIGTGTAGRSVPVDLVAFVDRLGASRVLNARADERASLSGVSITLADGGTIQGEVALPLGDVARALSDRLADLDQAGLGAAQGAASLWIEDGRVRALEGTPQLVADIGRVLVATTRQASAGRCGPYSVYGFGADYLSRTRTETILVVFDRRTNEVETRRTFRAPIPRCPLTIPLDQRTVGVRDTADADAFARERLTGV